MRRQSQSVNEMREYQVSEQEVKKRRRYPSALMRTLLSHILPG